MSRHFCQRQVSRNSTATTESCHIWVCSKFPDISMTFPWQNNSFPWKFLLFFLCKKKQLLAFINGNYPTHPGFSKGKSITVIISRPWVYICQADIYINTTQVKQTWWKFQSKNNVMTKFPDMTSQNSGTIPWHGSNGKISLTFFQNSLTFPWLGENFVSPWHFLDTWQPCYCFFASRHLFTNHRELYDVVTYDLKIAVICI